MGGGGVVDRNAHLISLLTNKENNALLAQKKGGRELKYAARITCLWLH